MGTNGVNNVYSSFYNGIGDNALFRMRANQKQNTNTNQNPNLPQLLNTPIASVDINDYQQPKKKNVLQIGLGIASVVAALAVGSIFLTRGGSVKTLERMNKWISMLDDKAYNLGATNKTFGGVQKFCQTCVNGVKKALGYVKVSANFTAIKDTLFRKMTDVTFVVGKKEFKPLKPIADACARLSEKITMSSVRKLGNKAICEADELSAYCSKYAQDILSKGADDVVKIGGKDVKVSELLTRNFNYNGKHYTGKEFLLAMSDMAKGLKGQVDDTFCAASRTSRVDAVKKGLAGLEQKVERAISPKNPQWKNNLSSGYVTENLSAQSRVASNLELTSKTRALTNGIEDMSLAMSKNLNDIRGQVLTKDKPVLDITRQLAKKLEVYRTLSGQQERLQRSLLNDEILALTKRLSDAIKGSHCTAEVKAAMLKQTQGIADVIETGAQKGKLQELQTMFRILHNGEGDIYAMQKGKIVDCSKAIRKAASYEKEAYKRQAELKIGAAFTDYAFLTAAAGVGIHQVLKQDNKDDMISASLTQGIPVFGTLGLCLYQTSKGMTGVGPLALALVGGKILNMVGTAFSDKYLASANSKKQFMQELIALRGAQQNKKTAA